MLIFIICYELIQAPFKYRFHADYIQANYSNAVKLCKLITVTVELIYLALSTVLDISIYLNILLVVYTATLSCFLEYGLKYIVNHKEILKDKTRLIELCNARKITKVACNRLILKYVEGYTYQEIADMECVDIETIKKSISRSRKKLFTN